jgi:hypothetical protein
VRGLDVRPSATTTAVGDPDLGRAVAAGAGGRRPRGAHGRPGRRARAAGALPRGERRRHRPRPGSRGAGPAWRAWCTCRRSWCTARLPDQVDESGRSPRRAIPTRHQDRLGAPGPAGGGPRRARDRRAPWRRLRAGQRAVGRCARCRCCRRRQLAVFSGPAVLSPVYVDDVVAGVVAAGHARRRGRRGLPPQRRRRRASPRTSSPLRPDDRTPAARPAAAGRARGRHAAGLLGDRVAADPPHPGVRQPPRHLRDREGRARPRLGPGRRARGGHAAHGAVAARHRAAAGLVVGPQSPTSWRACSRVSPLPRHGAPAPRPGRRPA